MSTLPASASASASDARSSASRAPSRGRRIVLIGGTSEIGLEIVRALGRADGGDVTLVGRDEHALQQARRELGDVFSEQSVDVLSGLDARDRQPHGELLQRAFSTLPRVDVAIVAVGLLGAGDPDDVSDAVDVLDVNLTGTGSLLMHVAKLMQRQGGGRIVVLSSAGAVRPRASSAAYGAAKAGLDALALALGDALAGDGVSVTVVRPGFVRTRMTAGMKQPPLACTPQTVADATLDGLRRRRTVIWAPSSMRWAMLVLRLLPRPLFRRLPL